MTDDAATLRALHQPGNPLVLPNVWDPGSAKLVAARGYPAIATTSAGVAVSLGYADGEATPPEEIFAALKRITRWVSVPVTADLESGYGLPADELVARMTDAGVIGLNIEDSDHSRGKAQRPTAEQADRIAAIRAVGDVVINARVDTFLRDGELADGLDRARRYLDAGADCVYPIVLADEAAIAEFVELGPTNVLLRPGAPDRRRLADLGVARISLGGGLAAIAVKAVTDALDAL